MHFTKLTSRELKSSIVRLDSVIEFLWSAGRSWLWRHEVDGGLKRILGISSMIRTCRWWRPNYAKIGLVHCQGHFLIISFHSSTPSKPKHWHVFIQKIIPNLINILKHDSSEPSRQVNCLLAAWNSRGAAFPKIETRFPPSAASMKFSPLFIHSFPAEISRVCGKNDTVFVNVKEPLSEQRVLLPPCDMPMPFGALLPLSLIFFRSASFKTVSSTLVTRA